MNTENVTEWSNLKETQELIQQVGNYVIAVRFLGFVILILNLVVVISSGMFFKKGKEPRCTYMMLGNISLADLLTGLSLVIGPYNPNQSQIPMCYIRLKMYTTGTIASTYSVAMIAVDRYLYIVHGLKYNRLIYPTRVWFMILSTWGIAFATGLIPLIIWSRNGPICWFTVITPPALIIFMAFVIIIPILAVVVIYSIILAKALKSISQINSMMKRASRDTLNTESEGDMRFFVGGSQRLSTVTSEMDNFDKSIQTEFKNETQSSEITRGTRILDYLKKKSPFRQKQATTRLTSIGPKKWKAIKVVLFTSGGFAISWVPYFIASIVFLLCDNYFSSYNTQQCHSLTFKIMNPIGFLGLLNSLLNPIIYAWWHEGFRRSFKALCFNSKQKIHSSFENLKCSNRKAKAHVVRKTPLTQTTRL